MSAFLGVPVDAAYHVVSLLVSALTPLLGGLAAAAAIVGATIAVRLFLLVRLTFPTLLCARLARARAAQPMRV